MNKKAQLYNIAYLRSIAIVIVVLYHAFCPYMFWHNFPSEYKIEYFSIFSVWLGARMPLFLFISGFLFSYLLNYRNKYQSFWGFLLNKTHRLFIPYIVFAILIMLSRKDFSWTNLFKGYSHLWFLLMLFWSFLITWGVSKIKSPIIHILFLVGVIVVSMYYKQKIPLAINFLIYYYVWFFLGYIIALYKKKLRFLFSKKMILIYGAVWIASSISRNNISFPSDHILYLVRFINALTFVLFVFSIFEQLFIHKHLKDNFIISKVNNYSYGIYIFHGWMYGLIFKTNYVINYIKPVAKEYTLLFPISYFIFSLGFSYLLTHYTLKTKAGRYLIG